MLWDNYLYMFVFSSLSFLLGKVLRKCRLTKPQFLSFYLLNFTHTHNLHLSLTKPNLHMQISMEAPWSSNYLYSVFYSIPIFKIGVSISLDEKCNDITLLQNHGKTNWSLVKLREVIYQKANHMEVIHTLPLNDSDNNCEPVVPFLGYADLKNGLIFSTNISRSVYTHLNWSWNQSHSPFVGGFYLKPKQNYGWTYLKGVDNTWQKWSNS